MGTDPVLSQDAIHALLGAGEAAEVESLTLQMTMERMAMRLEFFESAIQRITDIEEEVDWLRKSV